MTTDASEEVLAAVDGRLGTITLNRPKAINALTLPMIQAIAAALDGWRDDDAVGVVLIEGAGPRGLCAGGDIVVFHDSAKAGDDRAERFWAAEYAVNARIARYPKPVVVLMDGIVMGGGVGLSGHASHPVATERLTWAMPETRIGFFPDVGGTHLLGQAPGELGAHLGLTASRIGAGDAIACGFARHYVESEGLDALRAALRDGDADGAIAAAAGEVPAASLTEHRATLDPCYAQPTAREIVAALDAEGSDVATAAAEAIRGGSPTSVELTLQAIRRAAGLPDLEAVLEQDLRIARAFMGVPDMVEGIRAAVIDKDRNPQWSPASLDDVDPDAVARTFFGEG